MLRSSALRPGAAPDAPTGGSSERLLRSLIVAVVALPALLFAGLSWRSYHAQFQDAQDRLARTLDVAHEHAVKVFETHDLVAEQVNEILFGLGDEAIRAREGDVHARLKLLNERLEQINDLWVLDAAGRPLVTASTYPAPRALDLSDRAYFQAHRDGAVAPGRAYVSEVLRGRADPNATFFQVSVRRTATSGPGEAAFAGVTALSVEPRYFRDFYAQLRRAAVDTVTMVREDGAILARYPATDREVVATPRPSAALAAAIAESPEGGFYEGGSVVDGTRRIYAFRRLPRVPVYLVTGIDRSSVVGAWRDAMAGQLLFGVPAVAGLFTLALLALRRTQREGRALARLRAETQRRAEVEDQLRQSQKMEAVGRLTGGIAHDFNNLLQVVVGSLDMLSRRLDAGDERQRRLVANALEGANRAATLTQRLLAFSRQQPLQPESLDVNRVVGDLSDLLGRTLGEAIRIETVLAEGLWPTFADRSGLENALLNLAVNARDAMPEGGRLLIATANGRFDEADGAEAAGPCVVITIADSGTGMTPEVMAKAFEPFFTTKPTGQGTGLGLSMVFGFAKQSGGHVALASEPGRGTTVRLSLPRGDGPPPAPERGTDLAGAPLRTAGAETILVVEDEPGVRRFGVEALRDLGYVVLEADGAAAALGLLADRPDIVLMMTDVIMPDVNGRKLADAALRRRPDLKVLFMTGYSRDAIGTDGVIEGDVHLLAKPFTQAQLGAKLRELLASGRPAMADAAPQMDRP